MEKRRRISCQLVSHSGDPYNEKVVEILAASRGNTLIDIMDK